MIKVLNFSLRNLFVIFLFLIVGDARDVHANEPTKSEWVKASGFLATSVGLNLALRLVPTPACYWCGTNRFDVKIARAWEADNLQAARIASDAITFGIVPLMALTSVALFTPNKHTFLEDAVVLASSLLVTAALTELLKISVRRKRPEAVFGYSSTEDDNNKSFLSGHTSFSFSLLTSASVLAYKRGARHAPLLASASFAIASAAGLSRIIAAKHWATDVVAGMVLGIGIGAAMPFIILDDDKNKVTVTPMLFGNGLAVSVNW